MRGPYTEALIGRVFSHDDSVNERHEGSRLELAQEVTVALWRAAGWSFYVPGGMYRGARVLPVPCTAAFADAARGPAGLGFAPPPPSAAAATAVCESAVRVSHESVYAALAATATAANGKYGLTLTPTVTFGRILECSAAGLAPAGRVSGRLEIRDAPGAGYYTYALRPIGREVDEARTPPNWGKDFIELVKYAPRPKSDPIVVHAEGRSVATLHVGGSDCLCGLGATRVGLAGLYSPPPHSLHDCAFFNPYLFDPIQ